MVKAKATAKKMGFTFNDLIMGIISSALKEHFEAEGDQQETISISVPFTF